MDAWDKSVPAEANAYYWTADPVVRADRFQAAVAGCAVRSVGGAGVRLGGGAGVQVVNLRPAAG